MTALRYDILNFAGPGAVLGKVSGPGTVHVRTEPLPTGRFKELVTQVTLFARPYDTNAQVLAIPEISNDGQNWEARTGDQFGPLSTAGTEVKKQTTLGMLQRFDFQMTYLAPGSAIGGLNAQVVSIGREDDPGSGESGLFRDFAEYLDQVRRGISAAPPPGSGRIIPFWPEGTAMTSDNGAGGWLTIQTPLFPTHEYKKLIVQVVTESFIGRAQSSQMIVYPVASVPCYGTAAELSTLGFTAITTATTLPDVQTKDITTLGAWTGLTINFKDNSGLGIAMAAGVSIYGIGVL
jgi:hypothetical protein